MLAVFYAPFAYQYDVWNYDIEQASRLLSLIAVSLGLMALAYPAIQIVEPIVVALLWYFPVCRLVGVFAHPASIDLIQRRPSEIIVLLTFLAALSLLTTTRQRSAMVRPVVVSLILGVLTGLQTLSLRAYHY